MERQRWRDKDGETQIERGRERGETDRQREGWQAE